MKNALIAAILSVFVATSAHAGQVKDWSNMPLGNDIPTSCLVDFNASDDAFRECRRLTLDERYQVAFNDAKCQKFKMWNSYTKELASYENKMKQGNYGFLENTSGNLFHLKNQVRMYQPWKAELSKMEQVCNKQKWVQDIIEKELFALHEITK